MKIKGVAASPGIAIGRAYLVSEESYCVIKRNIGETQVKRELNRFKKAISMTEVELKKQKDRISNEMGKKYAHLFDAYMLMLKDPLLYKDTIKIVTEEKVNVEYALQNVIDKITKTFSMLDDEYMRDRVRDVQDVGNRIMGFLLGQQRVSLKDIQSRVAIVANTLHPSDIVELKKENAIGFVTDVGGRTSHIVIMAESLEIPAVVGLKTISREVSPGDLLVIDGNLGIVHINPEPEIIREYRWKKREQEEVKKKLISLKDKPAVTEDGVKIDIAANIETSDEVELALQYGANGIGLFRTEYMYLNRDDLPSGEFIMEKMSGAVKKVHGPVIVRTLDLGADKLSSQLGIKPGDNTFMGMRGIRLCLAYPGLFKTQLRAILRVSVMGKVCLMYPMISNVKELRTANHILSEVKDSLENEGIDFDRDMEVGAMIETPAAAIDIDHILNEVDFVSIGTNDLIQYTLAVNRVSESVSYLYNPADIAILNLLNRVINAANSKNKWISMCGEMSADTLFTELLLGMGLRKMSMVGSAILKVKMVIRNTNIDKCRSLAEKVLSMDDTVKITEELRENRNNTIKEK